MPNWSPCKAANAPRPKTIARDFGTKNACTTVDSPGDLGLASMEIMEVACESAQTIRNEIIRPTRATVETISDKSKSHQTAVPNSFA